MHVRTKSVKCIGQFVIDYMLWNWIKRKEDTTLILQTFLWLGITSFSIAWISSEKIRGKSTFAHMEIFQIWSRYESSRNRASASENDALDYTQRNFTFTPHTISLFIKYFFFRSSSIPCFGIQLVLTLISCLQPNAPDIDISLCSFCMQCICCSSIDNGAAQAQVNGICCTICRNNFNSSELCLIVILNLVWVTGIGCTPKPETRYKLTLLPGSDLAMHRGCGSTHNLFTERRALYNWTSLPSLVLLTTTPWSKAWSERRYVV